MSTTAYYLHYLNILRSLDLAAIHRLLLLCGSAKAAWEADIPTMKRARIKNAVEVFAQKKYIDEIQEWAQLQSVMEQNGITLLTIEDDFYPVQLKELSHPPQLLYCRGNMQLLKAARLIAIVGSRKATHYGKGIVKQIVGELTALDVVTVSGLALGIDSAVHKETLLCNKHTIAVLGSSVLPAEIMPPSNQRLAQQILENDGLLLSEYPPRTPGYPSNFPERNRIIAGLCQATIVVEAAQKSGSLITARLAGEASRDVFSVPGNITAAQSKGTNELIARGAIPFLSCDQLVDTLEWGQDGMQRKKMIHVTEHERKIALLCIQEPLSLDDIIARSDDPPHEVIGLITQLTLRGVIEEYDGGYYHCPYELSNSADTTE